MIKKRTYSLKQNKMLPILTGEFYDGHRTSLKMPWGTIIEGTSSGDLSIVS